MSTRSVPVRRHAPMVPVVQRQATSSRLHEEFSTASSTPVIPISPMTVSTDDTVTVTDVQIPTPVMPGRPIRYRTERGGGHGDGGHASGSRSPRPGSAPVHTGRRSPSEQREIISSSYRTRASPNERGHDDRGHASGSGSPRPGSAPVHTGRRSPSEQRERERELMSSSFRARASPSPTPSSVSSSIVHTLNNGTRIHVPAAPIEERGRPIARDSDRKKRSTFYIVPPGMNVIFQDADGNEITRVGDFNIDAAPVEYQEAPIILKDEEGRVIYQTGDDSRDEDDSADRPNVIHLGQFLPEGYRSARSTSPITVSLDQRGRDMLIYSDERKKFESRSRHDRSRKEPRKTRSPSAQSSRTASDMSRLTSVGR
ncbi:hypothetical protein OF83DRAFT_133316 [Amylostereum chailletii]|nr:hypothetical protein OF83DRAFT_133316 [Amylostereum chailletii]